jgi:hypothetical protein
VVLARRSAPAKHSAHILFGTATSDDVRKRGRQAGGVGPPDAYPPRAAAASASRCSPTATDHETQARLDVGPPAPEPARDEPARLGEPRHVLPRPGPLPPCDDGVRVTPSRTAISSTPTGHHGSSGLATPRAYGPGAYVLSGRLWTVDTGMSSAYGPGK